MLINFEKMPCYKDIAKLEKVEVNVKYQLANAMYTRGGGVDMGALALKIYSSKGEVDYTKEECALLLNFVKLSFSPLFIDSLEDIIKEN